MSDKDNPSDAQRFDELALREINVRRKRRNSFSLDECPLSLTTQSVRRNQLDGCHDCHRSVIAQTTDHRHAFFGACGEFSARCTFTYQFRILRRIEWKT